MERKTAVIYTRVSTAEQVSHGFSLNQQVGALRDHADREGLEIVGEFSDPGASGGSLARPGLDALRDRVAQGDVDVVLVQDLDRISREVVGVLVLTEEFRAKGCTLAAMNDAGADDPSSEMLRTIRAAVSQYERTLISERSRRGKMEKVRQGRLLAAAPRPRYGFRFTEDRTSYVPDPEKMSVVRRVFAILSEGGSIHGVQARLEKDGVPAPSGGRVWSRTTIRELVTDDVFRPHTPEEIAELVTPEVAATLSPDELYGVSWWGVRRTAFGEAKSKANGYAVRQVVKKRDKSECLAVPVPLSGSGLSREVVDAARRQIAGNRSTSRAGDREWPLSGGVLFCAECGKRMSIFRRKRADGTFLAYYRCRPNSSLVACANRKSHPAEKLEAEAWDFVSRFRSHPQRLYAAFDALIERQRQQLGSSDPERDEQAWLRRIAELDVQRRRSQDLAVDGLLSPAELRERLAA